MREVPHRPLDSVLELDIEKTPVEPGGSYEMTGVLSAGRGLFARGPMSASETKYSELHRLRAGQLVMRKLTAWEGPIAVVTEEFDGTYVSSEFPTFMIDETIMRRDYLTLICQTPWFWNQILDRSTGSVLRRKRLNPSALMTISVPCPPLSEQDEVVSLLAVVDRYIESLVALESSCRDVGAKVRQAFFSGTDDAVPADRLFDITMGRQRSPKHAAGHHQVPYLRAANVKDGYLDLDDVKEMSFTPAEQDRYRLKADDVLITEGCGSAAQLGAPAMLAFEPNGPLCFQNTLLRVRARPGVSTAGYAYQWARWAFEANRFVEVASGTNILHIGSERAKKMPVRQADPEEQEELTIRAGAADRLASGARDAHGRVRELRERLVIDRLGLAFMSLPESEAVA